MPPAQEDDFGFAVPPSQPPRGSWFSRNWWWFVPGLVGLPVCVCCGGFGLIFFGVSAGLKSSTPYQAAWNRVQHDPRVIEELGEPIEEDGMLVQGNAQTTNGNGSAHFTFDVKGPRGTAHVETASTCEANNWTLDTVEVTFDDGETLELVPPTDAAEPLNPLPMR